MVSPLKIGCGGSLSKCREAEQRGEEEKSEFGFNLLNSKSAMILKIRMWKRWRN